MQPWTTASGHTDRLNLPSDAVFANIRLGPTVVIIIICYDCHFFISQSAAMSTTQAYPFLVPSGAERNQRAGWRYSGAYILLTSLLAVTCCSQCFSMCSWVALLTAVTPLTALTALTVV